jgi:hypothetical protein
VALFGGKDLRRERISWGKTEIVERECGHTGRSVGRTICGLGKVKLEAK